DIAPSDIIKSVQTKESIIESFNAIMDLLDTMVTLLLIAAIILGVVVLYNLGVMSYTERYREMATLKVLGFRDNKIGRILIGQNLWVSVIGTLLGIPLGIWILDYLLHALAGDYEMELIIKPLSYLWSAAITLGVSLIVSIMISRKNKKIDMVEALKGTE
ncbi:MAG: FtsX-like permease family protein, partial [Dehalococcoidales bacterium]|nr:FtsX-like permease family protein [Dehalococcoidales bacterium]